ncbi:hypothetical protein VDG1235_4847 [Verrucomicrobiia bacterium DG1235]|nr:hypothetical protein VDG1235_4847 [Verrucomicrobiae bacterium DG1235]
MINMKGRPYEATEKRFTTTKTVRNDMKSFLKKESQNPIENLGFQTEN